MSKHRDYGIDHDSHVGYITISGDLWRRYAPYGRLHRAEYGLPARTVEIGDPFE